MNTDSLAHIAALSAITFGWWWLLTRSADSKKKKSKLNWTCPKCGQLAEGQTRYQTHKMACNAYCNCCRTAPQGPRQELLVRLCVCGFEVTQVPLDHQGIAPEGALSEAK